MSIDTRDGRGHRGSDPRGSTPKEWPWPTDTRQIFLTPDTRQFFWPPTVFFDHWPLPSLIDTQLNYQKGILCELMFRIQIFTHQMYQINMIIIWRILSPYILKIFLSGGFKRWYVLVKDEFTNRIYFIDYKFYCKIKRF